MASSSEGQSKIVRYGHPALREKTAPVGRVTADVKTLVGQMTETMRQAGGVGLAANQLGISRRVAVVEIDGKLVALIDPEIVSRKGEEIAEEGCLSLPRLYGDLARPTYVMVKARDLSGRRIRVKAEGLLARALCHEIDHLEGRLFVDRVDEDTLHWLIRITEEGEAVTQPTALEEALKVFLSASGRGER